MTVLQQLYEEIKFLEKKSNTGLLSIIDLKRRISNYYLEKEKQQIIDAYETGVTETLARCNYDKGTDYYEQTFNQPK